MSKLVKYPIRSIHTYGTDADLLIFYFERSNGRAAYRALYHRNIIDITTYIDAPEVCEIVIEETTTFGLFGKKTKEKVVGIRLRRDWQIKS